MVNMMHRRRGGGERVVSVALVDTVVSRFQGWEGSIAVSSLVCLAFRVSSGSPGFSFQSKDMHYRLIDVSKSSSYPGATPQVTSVTLHRKSAAGNE